MRNRKANQGFTLIELLIVIAIIGILAAVLIPNLLAARARANDTATQAYIRQCVTAVETARDPVTQALPATLTNCENNADTSLGTAALVRPNAVASSLITATGNDSFTVNAVSTTDASFTYNGTSIVAD